MDTYILCFAWSSEFGQSVIQSVGQYMYTVGLCVITTTTLGDSLSSVIIGFFFRYTSFRLTSLSRINFLLPNSIQETR